MMMMMMIIIITIMMVMIITTSVKFWWIFFGTFAPLIEEITNEIKLLVFEEREKTGELKENFSEQSRQPETVKSSTN